jgi:hypothetical protein
VFPVRAFGAVDYRYLQLTAGANGADCVYLCYPPVLPRLFQNCSALCPPVRGKLFWRERARGRALLTTTDYKASALPTSILT